MGLGTAVITIQGSKKGESFRALCDNGSEANLVAQAALKKLGLKGDGKRVQFLGINGSQLGKSLGSIRLKIQLPGKGGIISAEFLIVKTITSYEPESWKGDPEITNGLCLADEGYNRPGRIDLLLGVGIWIRIIASGVRRNANETIAAQNSRLGWIIYQGKRAFPERDHIGVVKVQESIDKVSEQLQMFWEMEEVGTVSIRSKEEEECEEFFRLTHSRDEHGRYIVRIPFNDRIHKLGASKKGAIAQFFRTERKMARNQEFAEKYRDFMNEYLKLEHMERISEEKEFEEGYYTPHHGVFSSNKFRVVFNASAKTSTGLSLNDTQKIGEKLQRDLFDILIDFRMGRYGYTGDIEKMYRQISIDKRDRMFQKIVWRSNEGDPLGIFQLKTVTYGHAAAPHCAIRAMVQCAKDHEEKFPNGARVIRDNFYVDDVIISCDTEEELADIRRQTIGLLQKGQMKLVKERRSLLESEQGEEKSLEYQETKAVLGILWNTTDDRFYFRAAAGDSASTIWTKRGILSKISRIFDPLGLVTPITLIGKMIFQELWKTKQGWDEPVGGQLLQDWRGFLNDIASVNKICVPRWIRQGPLGKMQIHGFCDASTKAYGAAVYARVVDEGGKVHVHLLTAKSKVAPLNGTTIPRLELCSALLLIRLMRRLKGSFARTTIEGIHCWSDSQITVYWLYGAQQGRGRKLKVFVANRVSEIMATSQELGARWHWVSGKDNPADMASRGIFPSPLISAKLWWTGPDWLGEKKWSVDDSKFNITEKDEHLAQEEMKILHTNIDLDEGLTRVINHGHVVRRRGEEPLMLGPWFKHKREGNVAHEFLGSYSQYKKLKRVTAMLMRAKHNFKFPRNRRIGRLTHAEGEEAVNWLIQQDQAITVREEIQTLRGKKGSHLNFRFDPKEKILRVVGRLENADLTEDEKNPIFLSPEGNLVKLLVRFAHERTLHGGTQEMLQFLRGKYWIPGLRRLVKQVPLRCPACFRYRIKLSKQQMAALPSGRVNRAFPFQHVGIDYAGPVILRSKYGRNPTLFKAWIGVFVCLVTRAVTLELISDATSVAFMAALRRVVARRGSINKVVSDNGTNFVGAAKVLRGMLSEENLWVYEREFELEWTHNPPYAPHHGGIFEAAVRSMKYHLRRVIGSQTLTYEEYDTLLKQVEGCMNSRPLGSIHDDASTELCLTPAHFLIGRRLVTLPEGEQLLEIKESKLKRWERVQQTYQKFWEGWKNSYLLGLIRRTKWDEPDRNTRVGDIVIVKSDNEPPSLWWLARVKETYPGKDGLVRTVKLSHMGKDYVRPITKLGLLVPIEEQGGDSKPF